MLLVFNGSQASWVLPRSNLKLAFIHGGQGETEERGGPLETGIRFNK